jgi:LacI family transcriptional regulator
MAKRPTIADLARAAGVSVATVDRVLNQRLTVRDGTALRVAEAAEQIGFYAKGLIQQRLNSRAPRRTLGFLLQKSDDFYRQLSADLAAAVQAEPSIQGRADVVHVEEIVPAAIAARLLELGSRCDAVAAVAVEHPQVNQAIRELRERGVPVFTLLANVSAPECSGHIGVDYRKAGRSAAWTITRTSRKPGKIGILIGSHRYLHQALAEISFRTYIREYAHEFQTLEPIVNLDDSRIAYEATAELIQSHPDLVGIYEIGGGMAGMIDAIRDEGASSRLVCVCNELVPATRAGLVEGHIDLVLATPTRRLAEVAVMAMTASLAEPAPGGQRQHLLPAELFISENV